MKKKVLCFKHRLHPRVKSKTHQSKANPQSYIQITQNHKKSMI